MRLKTFGDWVMALAVTVTVGIMFIGCFTSCTSERHVVKTNTSVDSSSIKEKSDSIRLLKIENERLTQEVNELQYSQVIFDTIFLPGDTIINTVTITKEGEVKASGKITSATVSKNTYTKIIQDKNRIIDSLSLLKQKEVVKVVTKTEYKTVDAKTKVLNFWWLLFIGFVGGVYVGVKHFKIFKK